MFFFGGLNTALPFLLYLSLIWAFMIIGFTGRNHFSGTHPHHEYRLSSDVKSFSLYGHHFNHLHAEPGQLTEPGKQLAFTVIKIPDKSPGITSRYLTNLAFRGPPEEFTI